MHRRWDGSREMRLVVLQVELLQGGVGFQPLPKRSHGLGTQCIVREVQRNQRRLAAEECREQFYPALPTTSRITLYASEDRICAVEGGVPCQ